MSDPYPLYTAHSKGELAMQFLKCKVNSVKANIATGELTIAFSMNINDGVMEAAESLALYVDKDAGKVELRVLPDQPPLKGLDMKIKNFN